jgi:hypothetical protein
MASDAIGTAHHEHEISKRDKRIATLEAREREIRSALLLLLEQIDDETTDSVAIDGTRYQSRSFLQAHRHALNVVGIE